MPDVYINEASMNPQIRIAMLESLSNVDIPTIRGVMNVSNTSHIMLEGSYSLPLLALCQFILLQGAIAFVRDWMLGHLEEYVAYIPSRTRLRRLAWKGITGKAVLHGRVGSITSSSYA